MTDQSSSPLSVSGVISEAEEKLANIGATVHQCEADRHHSYGCPHDGEPMTEPVPSDCPCPWAKDPCELCQERLDDATVIRDLLAVIRALQDEKEKAR